MELLFVLLVFNEKIFLNEFWNVKWFLIDMWVVKIIVAYPRQPANQRANYWCKHCVSMVMITLVGLGVLKIMKLVCNFVNQPFKNRINWSILFYLTISLLHIEIFQLHLYIGWTKVIPDKKKIWIDLNAVRTPLICYLSCTVPSVIHFNSAISIFCH